MNRDLVIGLCTALVCHGVALFAVRTPVAPPRLELASEPGHVEVTLVAAAPEPVVVEESPPPPPVVVPPPPPPVELPKPPPPPEINPKEPDPPPPLQPEPPPPIPAPTPAPKEIPAPSPPAPAPAPVPAPPPPVPPVMEVSPPTSPPVLARAIAPVAPAPSIDDAVRLSEPNYRRRARLIYPAEARRQGQSGVVVLSLWIDARGRTERVTVKESSGHPLLDEAALNMARRSEYVPARRGSEVVASTVEASYRFVLSQKD